MKKNPKKVTPKAPAKTTKPAPKSPVKATKPAPKSPAKSEPEVTIKKAPAKSHTRAGGLGRGLGALIDAPVTPMRPVVRPPITTIAKPVVEEKYANSVLTVPVSEIVRSPWQPRQTFDEAALRELADSIRANGIIQPLVCRKLPDGRFELIGGERRLRASQLAELTHVPVILIEAEDRKAAELAIVENIQRADLNAIEEAEGYRTLSEKFNLTQGEVAERVGKPRPSVANALRLLELPDETKAMVADGRLPAGHAKVILSLARTEDRIRMGRRVVTEGLTVRTLERIVANINTPPTQHRLARYDLPTEYLRDLIDRLHGLFGTAVRVTPSKTFPNGRRAKGMLEVDFYNNDDLDRILSILGIRMD
jgi:ParB family chromosome partitioning protein